MNKNKWFISVICLSVGAVLFMMNWTKFHFPVGTLNMDIYPAAFFTLLGGILVLSDLLNKKAAE